MGFFDSFFGNSKQPQVTTQTNDPWGPAASYAQGLLGNYEKLYENDIGYHPYTGQTQASLDPRLNAGLMGEAALARRPVPGLADAQRFASGMIRNNGMTADTNRVAGYLDPFARGDYQEDPRLAAAISARENRAANAGATRFGGGRYGSAAIGRGMGDAVSEAGNDLMLQSNESARNQQLQAAGLLGNMYESGLGRAAGAVGMLPGLNDLRYDGANRLRDVGGYMQDRRQGALDNQIRLWEAQQARPWEQLGRYASPIMGVAGLGGTRTGVAPPDKMSPFQMVAGTLGLLGDTYRTFSGGRSGGSFTPRPGQVPVGGPGWGYQG